MLFSLLVNIEGGGVFLITLHFQMWLNWLALAVVLMQVVLMDSPTSSAEHTALCSLEVGLLSWKSLRKTPSEVLSASGGTGQPLSTHASTHSASSFSVILHSLGHYGCAHVTGA